MSKFDELVAELCPDGVEYVSVGELCSIQTGSQLNKETLKDVGEYPVYNGGINPSGYHDDFNTEANTIAISQGGASAGFVNWVDVPFFAGAHCYTIKNVSKQILNRYLYFYLKNEQDNIQNSKHGAGIPGLNSKAIKNLRLPLPPLPVQQEIVRILDNFTELAAELTAELTARKKQYEYYRKKLLSFDESVPKMPLGSICIVQSGGTPSKAKHEYWGNGTIKWLGSTVCQNQKTVTEVTNYISEAGLKNSSAKLMKKDTTLIALVGATIGKIAFLSFEAAINQNIAGIYPNDITKLNPSYVFYACGMLYADFVGLSQGKLAMANLSFVRGLKIPVPSLEEQERIVAILDRFDALCNDLTSGLPAEIEARRKQYEYYRDKLLTFKEASA